MGAHRHYMTSLHSFSESSSQYCNHAISGQLTFQRVTPWSSRLACEMEGEGLAVVHVCTTYVAPTLTSVTTSHMISQFLSESPDLNQTRNQFHLGFSLIPRVLWELQNTVVRFEKDISRPF